MNDKKFLPPIIFALIIILSFGWYRFIYEPARREILNMELETRRLRQIEQDILLLKARHENLSAFLEEKESQLDDANNFLPPSFAQEKFIDQIYQVADSRNVKIISVRAGEITSSENLQSQIITVKLSGDYISLLNFIREILDGGRLAALDKISVENSSCDLHFKIFAVNH